MARIVTGLLMGGEITLFRSDRYDRVHSGGDEGRDDAGKDAGEQAHKDGQSDDVEGDENVEVQDSGKNDREQENGAHADQSTDNAKEGRLEEKFHHDGSALGADGFF